MGSGYQDGDKFVCDGWIPTGLIYMKLLFRARVNGVLLIILVEMRGIVIAGSPWGAIRVRRGGGMGYVGEGK
jgi:hypothetical protein